MPSIMIPPREAKRASLSIRLFEWLSVRNRRPDLARLRAIVSPNPSVRLLDIGGGAGGATERFASGCGRIVVVEPDGRKTRFGRRQWPSTHFVRGRGESLPFEDRSFDRVTSVVAFHHVDDQRTVLREMYRVLTPGGQVAVLEMPPAKAPGALGRCLGGLRHRGEMVFLEPAELVTKLEEAGFRNAVAEAGARSYIVRAVRGT
jgi:demethylmenaquinone methyltransferase/2-methoxy-6-polyprenyl-1,4-benzoquinol methylase